MRCFQVGVGAYVFPGTVLALVALCCSVGLMELVFIHLLRLFLDF